MKNYIDFEKKYFEKKYLNNLGDVIKIEYYTDLDETTNQLFNLAFSENITIQRNQQTGIPIIKTTIQKQIKSNEVIDSVTTVEKIDNIKGMQLNQVARENLIFTAQQYTLNKLIENHGETQGIENAKIFLDSVTNERQKYILGVITDLLNVIKNCDFSFITIEIKTELDKILNIKY